MKWCNNGTWFSDSICGVFWHVTGKWGEQRRLTWTGVHGVPLHALSEGEGGHVGVGVDALLHVAAPHALGAAAGALAAGGSHGARRPALLGAVVGWGTTFSTSSALQVSFSVNIFSLSMNLSVGVRAPLAELYWILILYIHAHTVLLYRESRK